MSDILVRHIPADAVKMAKTLASRHHRSLQEEVSNMLIEAIRFRAGAWSKQADSLRTRLTTKKKNYSDSATLQRQDRAQ